MEREDYIKFLEDKLCYLIGFWERGFSYNPEADKVCYRRDGLREMLDREKAKVIKANPKLEQKIKHESKEAE